MLFLIALAIVVIGASLSGYYYLRRVGFRKIDTNRILAHNDKFDARALLESKIIQAIASKKAGWTFINVFESGRVPIVPSEKRVHVGDWENRRVGVDYVLVCIYEVESPAEAAVWLNKVHASVAEGRENNHYSIGDEAYLNLGGNGKRFLIEFRRGNFVGMISANNLSKVREFAQYIVAQIPAE